MPTRDFFDCVEQIRRSEKYFDVSRLGIQRLLLAKGECEVYADHDVQVSDGGTHTAQLRLNVRTRSETPLAWTISLKLHGIRIDCIDHEARFKAYDGQIGRGWHRHMWDADAESAERLKTPVSGLDGVITREDFLMRALQVMRVNLDDKYGANELLLA